MDFDAPNDVQGGGGFIEQPGTYHFSILKIHEGQGKGKTPKPIDGFTVDLHCHGGTVAGSDGKQFSESFFKPDPSKSEGSQLANRRAMAAFFIAAGLMTPDQLGKSIKVYLEAAVGRQVVMKLVRQMERDGDGKYTIETKYVQLDYASVYHIDDPEVADVPKDSDALGMIPKELRRDAAWFEFKSKKSDQQPVAAAAAGGGNFDDI